jgi:RNA polymerase sigma factor (sigma-70 family)
MQLFRRQNPERSFAADAQTPTDCQLLEQFVERRDQDAFESLMRIHGPMVLGVCRRVTGHHHDAEEAFQAAFLVLARKAASIWPRHMLANWLHEVAYRSALKLRTATSKRQAKEKQIEMLPEPVAPRERDWQEIAPLLDRELCRLPETYRAAVICCDLQGYSRTDAARQLGWPEGTLKVRLMRARSILARRLTQQGVALSAGTLAVVLSHKAASAAVPAALLSSTAKAAGAVAATSGVSTSAGAKTATLVKGVVKSLYVGKTAVAAAAGGVTLTAALAFVPPSQGTPPSQTATSTLPAAVEQALKENAQQLTPISVSCTIQMKSTRSPTETFDRLKVLGANRSEQFFAVHQSRVVWQGNKVRSSYKSLGGLIADKDSTLESDIVYDGAAQVVLMGSTYKFSTEWIAQQKKKAANFTPVVRNLTKEPLAKVLERESAGIMAGSSVYFQPATGFVTAPSSNGSPTGGQQPPLSPSSAVLAGLNLGWKLIAVQNAQLEGRPLVRIDLEGVNPIQLSAVKYDLDAHRKRIERQREMLEKDSAKFNAEQKEMFTRSLAQQENMTNVVEAQRKLPATRRYSFYLDPQLHYAVRRLDQSYGSDTLLVRTDGSDFQQISGRNVWLPKKIESQFHEFYSSPGSVFKDNFLSQTIEVSAMSGDRVSDDAFKLEHETTPGTMVRDGTVRAKSSKSGGLILNGAADAYVSYTVPARSEDIKEVITRASAGENMVRFPGGPPLAVVPIGDHFRSGALQTIALCNAGLLGAVVAFIAWRRRKNALQ